jgi:hypothetical protein
VCNGLEAPRRNAANCGLARAAEGRVHELTCDECWPGKTDQLIILETTRHTCTRVQSGISVEFQPKGTARFVDAVRITGFVLNDGTPLRSVDVKVDDGAWQRAEIDPASSRYSCMTRCRVHTRSFPR